MGLEESGLSVVGCLASILKDGGNVFVRIDSKVGSPDPCRIPCAQFGNPHLDVIITDVTSRNTLTEVDDEEVGEQSPNDLATVGHRGPVRVGQICLVDRSNGRNSIRPTNDFRFGIDDGEEAKVFFARKDAAKTLRSCWTNWLQNQ